MNNVTALNYPRRFQRTLSILVDTNCKSIVSRSSGKWKSNGTGNTQYQSKSALELKMIGLSFEN
jgi:hypothetical protein